MDTLNDRVDQFLTWSFRAGSLLLLGRKQETVLVHYRQMMEVQQGGRLQDDGRAKNASRAHEKSTHTGENTICSTQVGSALSASVEDQQLMTEQDGFGKDGMDSVRPGNSDHGDDQMNEKKENVAHLWIIAKPREKPRFWPVWVIRHPQVRFPNPLCLLKLEVLTDYEIDYSGFSRQVEIGRKLLKKWSGREDLNLRPPGPEPGALPG